MKRIIAGTLGAIAIAVFVYSQKNTLISTIFERGFQAQMGSDRIEELEDGLHVALCGAGGPLPAPNASGPCVAVIAGKRLFVVDVGTDSPRNLARMRFQVGNIEALFLTHFHSDHIDGLGELATLRWAGGDNHSPLPVHGPEGVDRVVAGFNMAYGLDTIYRQQHHGDSVAPLSAAGLQALPFDQPAPGHLHTVLQQDGLTVESFAVNHAPVNPAVGYRFSYKGRSVVISGDTAKDQQIEKFARGVDLLVHEALAPNLVAIMHGAANAIGDPTLAKITADIPDYHASPVDAAETARAAGVGHLLYYHIVPPLVVPGQKALFLNGAEAIFPQYTIGEDGVAFSLPANSSAINKISRGL